MGNSPVKGKKLPSGGGIRQHAIEEALANAGIDPLVAQNILRDLSLQQGTDVEGQNQPYAPVFNTSSYIFPAYSYDTNERGLPHIQPVSITLRKLCFLL